MEKTTKIMILLGIFFTFLFVFFSSLVKDTSMIWIQTRIFGLAAYIFLFLAIMLGELRLLSANKGAFTLFRFHTSTAIFSTYLILLHFISAVFDRFKWGTTLLFPDYLGFNFSDKWMIFLSMGTLAFYLILIVGFTSARKSIQFFGFKRWKLIHYLSYLSFIIAYIHSVNLGTDIKTSIFAPYIHPFIAGSFLLVNSLMIVRILNSKKLFPDQTEINLAAVLVMVAIFGGLFLVSYYQEKETRINTLSTQIDLSITAEEAKLSELQNITKEVGLLRNQLDVIKNG